MSDTDQPKRRRRTKEEIAEEKRRWLLCHDWQSAIKASAALCTAYREVLRATELGVRPVALQPRVEAMCKELAKLHKDVMDGIPQEMRE